MIAHRTSKRALAVACVLLVVPVWSIGSASAQDVDAAVATFGLSELGLGGSVPLTGVDGRAQLTVPVPAGTTASVLNTTM
ncbi:MAG: hypothetical protein WBQ44_08840, partial [Rhodococcus sp. (in: high G+C Gram-positive bacteria)]